MIRSIYLDTIMVRIYHAIMSLKSLPRREESVASSAAVKYKISFCTTGLLIAFLFSCSKSPSYPAVQRTGDNIVIETSMMEPGVPKFFTYRFHDKNINFFVVKTPDSALSFLDACASCYPHKQGYRCEGGEVICRYCNTRYPISRLEKGFGNCYPIRIEGRTVDGKYLIPAALLERSADKF